MPCPYSVARSPARNPEQRFGNSSLSIQCACDIALWRDGAGYGYGCCDCHGARRRDAGILIALGHGIIEFPLMFLIILGFAVIIKSSAFQVAIGIIGGLFLLWMGVQMIREIRKEDFSVEATCKSPPVLTGLILSAGNPYFLLWWATVGLKLATDARQLGWIAFVLFTIVHWLCDLVWLGFLGWMSYGGAKVLGNKSQRIIGGVCGTALILFSIKFVYSAGALWLDVLQRA